MKRDMADQAGLVDPAAWRGLPNTGKALAPP